MPARTPEETHARLEAALNARDIDAFVEVYEEGATLIAPPENDVVTGRDEIRSALRQTFALDPDAEIEVIEKLEGDGLALTLARWRITGKDPDNGTVELSGRGSIVSRRQPDGSWRIVLDIPIRPD